MRKTMIACALSAFLLVSSSASASTILKFGLSETGSDLIFENGVLMSNDDGNLATAGSQDTGINFTSFLDSLFTDIQEGGSFTLASVATIGDAVMTGPMLSQQTNGGTFSIWNEANELLLSAELGEGIITGTETQSTGSFFNTEVVNYTGGSLLELINPNMGGISLSLASIYSDGEIGLKISNASLSNFTANSNGLLTGEPIPEPSTALLLLSGFLGVARVRRRNNKLSA